MPIFGGKISKGGFLGDKWPILDETLNIAVFRSQMLHLGPNIPKFGVSSSKMPYVRLKYLHWILRSKIPHLDLISVIPLDIAKVGKIVRPKDRDS